MGVWPCGAQVRTTLGINWKPDSSANTIWAPSRAAFFYTRPVFLFPVLDRLLILLQCTSFGLLRTPLQAMQQPPDVVPVILNSKGTLDQFRNTRRGPQIGSVTMGKRSLQKQIYQAFSLYLVQLQRTAGRVAYPQSLGSPTPAGITPAHHRASIAPDATPHLVERTTRIQQRQSSLAPVLQQIGAPLQSRHRC